MNEYEKLLKLVYKIIYPDKDMDVRCSHCIENDYEECTVCEDRELSLSLQDVLRAMESIMEDDQWIELETSISGKTGKLVWGLNLKDL